MEKVGITRESREKALALYKTAQERTKSLRADLKIKEAELSKLLVGDAYQLSEVEKKLREISEVELTIRLNRIKTEMELRDLIGKDRWARLRKFLRERADKENGRSDTPKVEPKSVKPNKKAM